MEGSMFVMESPKRSSASSSSSLHEFEFWKVGRNSSSFVPPLESLTADELFVDGVLLPLHFLSLQQSTPSKPDQRPTEPDLLPLESEPELAPELASDTTMPSRVVAVSSVEEVPPSAASITASVSCSPSSGSKRWKDIFKIGERKEPSSAVEDKEPRKERKGSVGGRGAATEQLHINIWPFSRSRSAGNSSSGSRTRASGGSGRKVSSAPCSRSNSRGDSSKQQTAAATAAAGGGRRWAASPGRSGGVPVGRASPVWQVPRGAKAGKPATIRRPERKERVTGGGKKPGGGGIGVRVLNLNVNTCIGYRGQVSCRDEDKDGATGGERTGGEGNGSLFGLRTLFSKKVY